MSLRVRINLVITLVTVAFTAAMVHVIVNDLRSSVREEIESTTRVAVQLIETVVAGVYLEPGPAQRTEALLALLRRVGRVRSNDIRFYDESGALLYQSPPATYRSGGWAPQWFARLVRPEIAAARLKLPGGTIVDRKSTRLNSSHLVISYAVFCLKKKKHNIHYQFGFVRGPVGLSQL